MEPQDRTGGPEPQRKEGGKAAALRLAQRPRLLGLLLVNYVVVSLLFSATANPRVEIPYRPLFMAQLRDGNVATITAKGLGIEARSRKTVRYPDKEAPCDELLHRGAEFMDRRTRPTGAGAGRRGHRGTDGARDAAVADAPHVPRAGAAALRPLACSCAGQAAARRACSRSGARGRRSTSRRRSASPSTTSPASRRPSRKLAEVVDFLRDPAKYTKLGARIRATRAPGRLSGTRKTLLARGRRGSRRAVLLDVRLGVRRDDRRRGRVTRS